MWDLDAGQWTGIAVVVAFVLAVAIRIVIKLWTIQHRRRARKRFREQRERLEARFFDLAAASGKPRGLRWTDIDFEDEVCFARDRDRGHLLALVAATISFELNGGLLKTCTGVAAADYTALWVVYSQGATSYLPRVNWATFNNFP